MKTFLPLFNSPLFDEELQSNRLFFDSQNLWRFLEVLLFPEMPYQVEECTSSVCRVTSPVYPSASPLYTHSRLISPCLLSDRPSLPSLSLFLQRIDECVEKKIPYLWGGNLPEGVDVLRQIYPLHSPLDSLSEQVFDLRGVDCSGLIYWASSGVTARNTSELIFAGTGVQIEGLSSKEIVSKLQPGMIIVWKGHVLVVTNQGIVESKPLTGVIVGDPQEVIDEILREKKPLNAWPAGACLQPSFVVRDLFSVF